MMVEMSGFTGFLPPQMVSDAKLVRSERQMGCTEFV